MAQLLVRNLETAVVQKLRSRAAVQGVSVEEAHRRLLRTVLLGDSPSPPSNFIEYLRSIPPEETIEFTRAKDFPREFERC
jgi:plasmid stability protein